MKRLRRPERQDEIYTALDEMPETYLRCRDLRHAWEQQGPFLLTNDGKTIERTLTCLRCASTRSDSYLATTFGKIRTTYHYPKGYTLHQMRAYMADVRDQLYLRMNVRKRRVR